MTEEPVESTTVARVTVPAQEKPSAAVQDPHGPGWVLVGKFLDPSVIAAIAATGVGLWMLIKQPDREVTAWALITAGGLLVPALGTLKRLTGGRVSK